MDPLHASQEALPGPANDSAGIPSPQFALLNYFLPGYSVLLSTLHASLGVDVNRYLPFILAAVAVVLSWRYVCDTVMHLVESAFMSSFTVHTDDETYNILMWWMTRQPFCHRTRNFVVNTSVYSRSDYLYRPHDESSDADADDVDDGAGAARDGNEDPALTSNRGKHVLHYTPSAGTHWFFYRGVPLRFSRRQTKEKISLRNPSEQEELCVSCLGRNPTILKRLLADARLLYLKKDDSKTIIYRATSSVSSYGTESYWQRCMSRPNRDFSTVILPDKVKKDIIADAGDYLEPSTRRWYANRGIPYRRGYLLHGPPGTGKSSLSVALAGYFRMKIYIVSLSSLTATEENLASLFAELPTNCIVLLEDIDTAGLSKTREKKKEDDDKEGSDNTPSQGQLSLSALLNILDGVAAQEGRVLIMTTNHVESLDKALIRPGRVDMIIPFQLADADMSESIFKAIYTPFDGEPTEAGLTKTKAKETLIDEVAVLAKEFGRRIPADEFSPAEIQGLLLRHKRSSQAAVEAVETWVVQMRTDKKDKAERELKEKEEKEKKEKEEKEKKDKEEKEKKKSKNGNKDKKEKKEKKEKKDKKTEKKKAKKSKKDETEDEDDDDAASEDESEDEEGKEKIETGEDTGKGGGNKEEEKDKNKKEKKQKQEPVAAEAKTDKVDQGKQKSGGSSDSGYATP